MIGAFPARSLVLRTSDAAVETAGGQPIPDGQTTANGDEAETLAPEATETIMANADALDRPFGV